jgi:Domain of unknown function (DUF4192)
MTSSEPPATVSLSNPGDLIAATPVLLGFVPRSSLVAMSLGGASGRRLGLTLRIDLPPPEHIAEAAEAVVHGILLDKPSAVVLLVIGPGGDAGPPAVELVERVIACLGSQSVEACHALWTESTAAGSRWHCYDECGCTGVVPRSSASGLAAAARAEGRIVRADRAELERLVVPVDAGVLRRREALLDAAVNAEADTLFAAIAADADGAFAGIAEGDVARTRRARRADAGPDPRADAIEGIAALDAALDAAHAAMAAPDDTPDDTAPDTAGGGAAGSGHPPVGDDHWLDDQQVVALTRALQSPAVREAAIAACTGSRPDAAATLWAALTRGTPDPEAAEPAALLALMGLLQGDGALANVALQRAEAAWPGHHFTATLRGLAAIGIRPGELRNCLTGAPVPGVSRQRPKHRGRAQGSTSRSARRHRRGR